MHLTYEGWSGLWFRHGGTWLGFDPAQAPPPNAGPDRVIVCVSHGHPDHFEGARELSRSSELPLLARSHVVSTPPVIRRLSRARLRHLHALRGGESTEVDGVRVHGFWWDHMTLLPPERDLRAIYLQKFLSHPFALANVALHGLGSPIAAPTLGFVVELPDGPIILNYGEGLHRNTDPRQVEEVSRRYQPDVLCLAVEPEDLEAVATWVSVLDAPIVLVHEAHRPWRDAFGLPHVHLQSFCAEMSARLGSRRVIPLARPGTALDLEKVS